MEACAAQSSEPVLPAPVGRVPAGEEGWCTRPASSTSRRRRSTRRSRSWTSRGTAKVMAGGQSLIPLMKLRFAAPRRARRPEPQSGSRRARRGGRRRCGSARSSATRPASARSLLRGRYRALGDAAPQISDPIVRNRGTVCGSLAHADPQGDWGARDARRGAEVVARGSGGERTIPVDELFDGPFTTTLAPNEIVTRGARPGSGPAGRAART